MKKFLIALLVLVLIILSVLFFWDGGRERVSDFFNEGADFGSFFDTDPRSQNDTPIIPPAATSTPVAPGPYDAPTLRQISFEPISGFMFYSTTSTSTRVTTDPEQGEVLQEYVSTSTAIRFQERATGHVYDAFTFLEPLNKVSNITIQKIYSTLFTNDKNQMLALNLSQDNESIRTTLLKIIPAKEETKTASSTPQSVEQSQLSSAMDNVQFVQETNRLLYTVRSPLGTTFFTSDTQRASEKAVAATPLSDVTVEYVNGSKALVQTKASANVRGYAYTLDLVTGSLNKVTGNIPGLLVKMSSDLKYYLYSESTLNRPVIRAYDTTTGTTRQIGLQTIPEKCVFSKKVTSEAFCFGSVAYKAAQYPDAWFKGKVFNTEHLYKIDLATGSVVNVYLFENEQAFDVINPKLSPNEDMIGFQNKYDLTLWALDLDALDNQF